MNRIFLPEISFCETDAAKVEEAVITKYEELADTTLYPGDPVRLFLEGVAYLLAQQNVLIDVTGKQNLLHYSQGEYLDHLGNYLNTFRLESVPAKCKLLFSVSEIRPEPVTISEGTRVRVDGSMVFATNEEVFISAGELSVEVDATCLIAGSSGNGFVPGQIKALMDPIAYISKVQNITVSAGGEDIEADENFRGRVALAAEQFAVAGPGPAIEYHAKSAYQGVIDTAIWQISPGVVHIAPLMAGGEIPNDGVLTAIHNFLNKEEVKPFTDTLVAVKPTVVAGEIRIKFYVLISYAVKEEEIVAQVSDKVEQYILWQRSALGRDILPQKLTELIQGLQGIQRVEVITPVYRALNPWEIAHLVVSGVEYGGLADE